LLYSPSRSFWPRAAAVEVRPHREEDSALAAAVEPRVRKPITPHRLWWTLDLLGCRRPDLVTKMFHSLVLQSAFREPQPARPSITWKWIPDRKACESLLPH